jgi:hypothetical protein
MFRRTKTLAALLAVFAAVLFAIGVSAGGVAAQGNTGNTGTTSTTAPPTTTTTAPRPTTTVPPTTATTTTTTLAPTTTTTHAHATTTSTTQTVTTTTAAATSSSSSVWGWVLLAVVIVLAALLVIWLILRNRRQGSVANWKRSVTPAIAAAELARELILSQSPTDDEQRRASVGVQVDEAVAGLERAADTAPDDASRALSTRSADSLRGLAFAVEADHLMRSGGEHPSGEQLAAADAARRNRSAELDIALRELKAAVAPTK